MDLDLDDIPESLNERKTPPVNMGLLHSLLRPQTVEIRAETAFSAASKFLSLLNEEFTDQDEFRRLMMTWLRAVKDNDFQKFRRVLRRAEREKKNPSQSEDSEPQA